MSLNTAYIQLVCPYIHIHSDPHPSSQADDELDSVKWAQELGDDLCHQTDEVHQLIVLHHIVLLYYLPYESRHEPDWRNQEV